jgi:hypothetical protein
LPLAPNSNRGSGVDNSLDVHYAGDFKTKMFGILTRLKAEIYFDIFVRFTTRIFQFRSVFALGQLIGRYEQNQTRNFVPFYSKVDADKMVVRETCGSTRREKITTTADTDNQQWAWEGEAAGGRAGVGIR